MRIVFMGTPDFAVKQLQRLVQDGHEIAGVFTQPDKPRNRNKVTPSPVKIFAEEKGFPVFQPEKMRDGTALTELQKLVPDMIVVAAYGKILPEDILSLPPYGCINVHASLLPKYRGAAPINRAVINGDAETGVTIMYMAKECDTGDMILLRKTPIFPQENSEDLFIRLADLGADALSEAIRLIEEGRAERTPQDHVQATIAPMLTREESAIDWKRSAHEISCQIRGLIPWPCASMTLDEKACKVFRSEPLEEPAFDKAGKMRSVKRGIAVCCGDGKQLLITELQMEGGKRMAASAYLNGRRIAPGTILN